jgi:hypothetical protein
VADEIFKVKAVGEWYGTLAEYAAPPDTEVVLMADGTVLMTMTGKVPVKYIEDVRLLLCRSARDAGKTFVTKSTEDEPGTPAVGKN